MRQFRYQALRDGERQEGEVSSIDEPGALRELAQRGLVVLSLETSRVKASAGKDMRRRDGVTAALRQQLLEELATLLQGGVALAEALPSLEGAHARDALATPLAGLRRQLRAGAGFAPALRFSGLQYPEYVFALLEAGEASGELGDALAEAAAELDEEARLRQELASALLYPAILLFTGVVVVLALFVLVLPRFASLIRGAQSQVPLVSRMVIEAGVFVHQNAAAVLIALGAFAAAGLFWLRRPEGRARALQVANGWSALFGWIGDQSLGRWAQLLGRLLSRRVPLLKAISLSRASVDLPLLRQRLAPLGDALKQGGSVAQTLGEIGVLSPSRVALLAAGERAGQLPRQLERLGAQLRQSARLRQMRALRLVEPLAILLIGGVVGLVMVAVILAITSLGPMGR